VLQHQGTSTNDYQFVGGYGVRKLNDTLGVMGVRQYSETVGRFTTQDPLGRRTGDLNFYRYVWNSPEVLVDPTGLIPDCFTDIFIPCLIGKSLEPNASTGGAPVMPESISLSGLTAEYAAARYAIKRGLTYWNKSSIYRRYLKLPTGVTLLFTNYDIWSCVWEEMHSCCQ
jgi:RHS repeat-associated protein